MPNEKEQIIVKVIQVAGLIFTGIAAACTMVVSTVNAKNEGKTLSSLLFKHKGS